jgi:hypothetical protein
MKPVLQILGAMLVHEGFQLEMQNDPQGTLQSRGYSLTGAELEVALRIVKSFKDGDMDDAVDNVRAECPNWPCNDGSLSA